MCLQRRRQLSALRQQLWILILWGKTVSEQLISSLTLLSLEIARSSSNLASVSQLNLAACSDSKVTTARIAISGKTWRNVIRYRSTIKVISYQRKVTATACIFKASASFRFRYFDFVDLFAQQLRFSVTQPRLLLSARALRREIVWKRFLLSDHASNRLDSVNIMKLQTKSNFSVVRWGQFWRKGQKTFVF